MAYSSPQMDATLADMYKQIAEKQAQDADFQKRFGSLPDMPTYSSIVDANGNLSDDYTLKGGPDVTFKSNLDPFQSKLDGIQLNTDALQELRKRSTQVGPTDQANYLLGKQGIEQASALDSLVRQNSAGTANAYSQLAQRGGLSKGARERIATKSMRSGGDARATADRQGMTDRLGILSSDEAQKLGILQALPGMETNALQPDLQKANMYGTFVNTEAGREQDLDLANRSYTTDIDKTNLASKLQDKKSKQDFDMGTYSELMKGYAANREATAQENSGKK